MQDNDFYVTLPSNGASTVYSKNRPSCYRTDIQVNKELLTDWEVGLSQIQFTHNWDYATRGFQIATWIGKLASGYSRAVPIGYAITDLEKKLLDKAAAESAPLVARNGLTPTAHVICKHIVIPESAQWRHVDEFGAYVAKCIQDAYIDLDGHNIRVSYERTSANTTVFRATDTTAYEGDSFIGIVSEQDEIFEILGMYPHREASPPNTCLKAYLFGEKHPVPRSNGFANIETVFVYTDVCVEQIIGSQVGNLLKLVPVTAGKGERQCSEYQRPMYVRLKPTCLTNIEIKLCDLTGTELAIWNPNSLVTVVLHFRKRKVHESLAGWC
jgi:hypothetical protein